MKRFAAVVLTLVVLGSVTPPAVGQGWEPPPPGAGFDYQIGGRYPLPNGATVVSRDWFEGRAPRGSRYGICYINAFQTQADIAGVDRPDERSNWPQHLVLTELGDDPNWAGEFLIDIGSRAKRRAAVAHVMPMIDACADAGFDAVEFDNLDSWTRFRGTPLEDAVPFRRKHTIKYARQLTAYAHEQGLAVARKNTPQFGRRITHRRIGFDFAIAESCGVWRECHLYTRVFGDNVLAIEYTDAGFRQACESIGDEATVIRRDIAVSRPGSPTYRYDSC